MNQSLPNNGQRKKTFHVLQQNRFFKRIVLLQPPLDKKYVFYKLSFLKRQKFDVDQKHKEGKNAKIMIKDLKAKQDKNQKNRKDWFNNLLMWYFDVVLFMKQKPRTNGKETKRQKQGSRRKQKRK